MKFTVATVSQELTFEINPNSKPSEVLTMVYKTEGITQPSFFGLNYKSNGEEVWIERSKKSMTTISNLTRKANFCIKYYPESVEEELFCTATIENFYLELKTKIVNEDVYCPPETSVLLAALVLQVTYGDFSEKLTTKIKLDKILAKKVLSGQKMGKEKWVENIITFWKKYDGMDKEEAMFEYLKIAQSLDTYGITYFKITNQKGTNVLLGITAYGLNIYEENNRLTPNILFPWSEIKHLKFKDRKFTIQLVDKQARAFYFITASPKSSKNILNLGVGNHTLYVKRRKPDPPEIQKLKEKAKYNKEKRQLEKQKLLVEKNARVELEKKEQAMLLRIQKMEADMENKNRDLLEAQKTIEKLTAQLEDLQRTKDQLEQQRNELNEMMKKLEESKNMEAMERQKLEDEIRAKHEEVERISREVQEKDEETRKLQEAVEEARKREEERRLEEEKARLEEEERLRLEAEAEEERRRTGELETVENDNDTLPETQIKEDVEAQLRILQQQLAETKVIEEETEEDKIYRENLRAGREKYKTLRDIRSGNTKRRAELFENM